MKKLTQKQKDETAKEIKKLSKNHELGWAISEEKDGSLWICASVDEQIGEKSFKEVGHVKVKKISM